MVQQYPSSDDLVNKNGLIQLAIINPEYAKRVLDQQEQRLNDIMRKIRQDNITARKYCGQIQGIDVFDDKIEEKIKEYEAIYGKL